MTRVISICNLKGGVGKTTISTNLASGLSRLGNRVLLIDADLQASATEFFIGEENEPEISIYDLMVQDKKFDKRISAEDILISMNVHLDILPASANMASLERYLTSRGGKTWGILKKELRLIKQNYDYILIDCPPVINLMVGNAYYMSDEVLIPTSLGNKAVRRMYATIAEMRDLDEDFEHEVEISVLFNLVNRNNHDKYKMQEVREQLSKEGIHVLETAIRNQATPVDTSAEKQRAVFDTNSNVGKEFKEMIAEIGGTNIWEKV